MSRKNAEELFSRADELYREGSYADALDLLLRLDTRYPGKRRLRLPMARCMMHLGRLDEAAEICDQLIVKDSYAKAAKLRRQIEKQRRGPAVPPPLEGVAPASRTTPPLAGPGGEEGFEPAFDDDDDDNPSTVWRMTKWALRVLFLGGLGAGMYLGYVPYWLGGGLIGAYLALVVGKWLVGKLMFKVFSTPFKLKGMALNEATVELHGVERMTVPPEAEEPSYAYYLIDVTITPSAESQQNSKFTYWEPGELGLIEASSDASSAKVMNHMHQVEDYRVIHDGPPPDDADDDRKYVGPLRLNLTVGMPPAIRDAKFAYYFTTFGHLTLPG